MARNIYKVQSKFLLCERTGQMILYFSSFVADFLRLIFEIRSKQPLIFLKQLLIICM